MTIECFQDIIAKTHVATTSYQLKLKDTQSGMIVNLSGVPQVGLLIDIQRGKAHPALVKDGCHKKSCDKLLLIQNGNSIDAYFIELKITLKPDGAHVPRVACYQIINTIPVLDYLISMISINLHNEVNDKIKINKYLVVVGEKAAYTLDKQGTKPKRYYDCCYKGKQVRVIHSSPTIPFTKLKSKTP